MNKALIVMTVLLVAAPALVGTAAAQFPPRPNCFEIYQDVQVGPVLVVQRSSCSVPEVYVDGERVLP